MKDYIYSLLNKYKKESNIKGLRALYNGNPNDLKIKFEYAKSLIISADNNSDNKQEKYEEAEKMLMELLESRNDNYSLFELAKLEIKLGNISEAEMLFKELLNKNDASKRDIEYATLELGRIEWYYKNEGNARKYFDFLLKTPSKDFASLELGKIEAESGNNELAKEIFYKLINEKSSNSAHALSLLIMLLIKENNYEEAVRTVEKYNMKLKYRASLLLSKELNIFFSAPYKDDFYSYSMQQILDYDEYVAIGHITDRHTKEDSGTSFNKEIDLYKLFNDIKSSLTKENKINRLVVNDVYSVYYPNIGANGEEYLRVITLPNTTNILTMYPIKNKYDICYEEREEDYYDDNQEEYKDNSKYKSKTNNKSRKKRR